MRVVIQEPGKARILRALQFLIAEVEERLWIADTYFLSIPGLPQSLMAAARDGIDVRILLPATNTCPGSASSRAPVIGGSSRAGCVSTSTVA